MSTSFGAASAPCAAAPPMARALALGGGDSDAVLDGWVGAARASTGTSCRRGVPSRRRAAVHATARAPATPQPVEIDELLGLGECCRRDDALSAAGRPADRADAAKDAATRSSAVGYAKVGKFLYNLRSQGPARVARAGARCGRGRGRARGPAATGGAGARRSAQGGPRSPPSEGADSCDVASPPSSRSCSRSTPPPTHAARAAVPPGQRAPYPHNTPPRTAPTGSSDDDASAPRRSQRLLRRHHRRRRDGRRWPEALRTRLAALARRLSRGLGRSAPLAAPPLWLCELQAAARRDHGHGAVDSLFTRAPRAANTRPGAAAAHTSVLAKRVDHLLGVHAEHPYALDAARAACAARARLCSRASSRASHPATQRPYGGERPRGALSCRALCRSAERYPAHLEPAHPEPPRALPAPSPPTLPPPAPPPPRRLLPVLRLASSSPLRRRLRRASAAASAAASPVRRDSGTSSSASSDSFTSRPQTRQAPPRRLRAPSAARPRELGRRLALPLRSSSTSNLPQLQTIHSAEALVSHPHLPGEPLQLPATLADPAAAAAAARASSTPVAGATRRSLSRR